MKNPTHALDFFQKAQAADPVHAGAPVMRMAIVASQDHPQEAESLYRRTLTLEEPGSAQEATALEGEAASLREQASAARKALGTHTTTIRQAATATPYRIGIGVTALSVLYLTEWPAASASDRSRSL